MAVQRKATMNDDLLRLPFDQYQRYRLIQEIVARLPLAPGTLILDVGGWPGTLQRFLPEHRVIVADLQGDLPNLVIADGTNLPFANNSFDLVTASDTLEHIAPGRRGLFLAELRRVSRDTVIIGAPFDRPDVRRAEAVLREAIREKYPESYGFIEEHLEYGLPDLGETLAACGAGGAATVVLPNGYLPHWLAMLVLYFRLQWRSPHEPLFGEFNAFYNETQYRADNRGPSYRSTIVARPGDPALLESLRRQLCVEEEALDPSHADFWPRAMTILQAIDLETRAAPAEPMRRILELEGIVEERTTWARQAVHDISARDEAIAALRARCDELERLVEEQTAWAQQAVRDVEARDATIHELMAERTPLFAPESELVQELVEQLELQDDAIGALRQDVNQPRATVELTRVEPGGDAAGPGTASAAREELLAIIAEREARLERLVVHLARAKEFESRVMAQLARLPPPLRRLMQWRIRAR